jgi:hypothetical protein
VLGQLIAEIPDAGARLVAAHVAPESVLTRTTSPPTAKHVVVLGQLTPNRSLAGDTNPCCVHACPADVVHQIAVPTATQVEAVGQLMPLNVGGELGGDSRTHPVPPTVVPAKKPWSPATKHTEVPAQLTLHRTPRSCTDAADQLPFVPM